MESKYVNGYKRIKICDEKGVYSLWEVISRYNHCHGRFVFEKDE